MTNIHHICCIKTTNVTFPYAMLKINSIQLPLWTTGQLLARAAAYTTHDLHNTRTNIPSRDSISWSQQPSGCRPRWLWYRPLNEYKFIAVLTSLIVFSVVELLQCLCITWYGDIVHTAFTERVFHNSTPEIEKLFYKKFGTQWSLKLYNLVTIQDVVTTQT